MAKFFSRKYVLAAAGGALILGLLHALPFLGGSPQLPVIFSAARGIAHSQGLAGYTPASFPDRWSAMLWHCCGETGLVIAQILGAFLPWTFLAFLLLIAARALGRFTASARIRALLVIMVTVLLIGSCWTPLWQTFYRDRGELVLSVPTELAESARTQAPGAVFANPSTLPYLLLLAPGAVGTLDPREAADLTANPVKWREALRNSPWTAVALSGALSEYQPLLEHLLLSPDWRLVRVTNQGYFFIREEGPAIPSLSLQRFHLSTPRDTAVYLAQIAEQYNAIRRSADAHSCITEALKLAPDDAQVLSHAASLESANKHWQDAIDLCDKALQADPLSAYPRLLKAVALLESGQPDQAEAEARRVLDSAPDDPYSLFLYARISRARHDYVAEGETLEKMIRHDTAAGVPVPGTYYVYLGQAYAKQGLADQAIAAYQVALKSPGIDATFATEVREAIATIQAKKP